MNRELLQGPSIPQGFGFEKEHELLRSQARRLLAERFDRRALRAFYEKPTSYRELYRELAALGWLTMDSWLATALLLEEIGRVLLPLPISPGLLAAQALPPEEREAVTSGEMLATVALDTDGPEFRGVPWIESGLLVAPSESGLVCCDLPEVVKESVVDRTKPTARVSLAGVPLRARCAIDLRAMLERAWLLHAAETLGAAEAVLSMTRDYAIERRQFDRPIGSYQAVSHPLVNVMIAVESARSLVTAAAAALDQGVACEVACRMAKVAACEALWLAANRGVQLHGGFGFTWECDVHFYFRRALFARGALGGSEAHRRRLAALLFDHGAP